MKIKNSILNRKMWNRYFRKAVQAEEGLSLIEVVLIIVIVSIVAVPISDFLFMNTKASVQTRNFNEAAFHMQARMEDIILMFSDDTRGYDYINQLATGESSEEVPAEGYTTWITRTAPITINGITYVDITVHCSYPGGENPISTTTRLTE
jgi:type II secretory pathway pseudopilin PulG